MKTTYEGVFKPFLVCNNVHAHSYTIVHTYRNSYICSHTCTHTNTHYIQIKHPHTHTPLIHTKETKAIKKMTVGLESKEETFTASVLYIVEILFSYVTPLYIAEAGLELIVLLFLPP